MKPTSWAHISHKAVARMAGLGWQGKSLLLINPEYGPRVRLVTILTDMPLTPDGPVKNRCGACLECVQACPASAIKNALDRQFLYQQGCGGRFGKMSPKIDRI